MQLVHQKQNYVEKIIRDADGRLLRATFCVYENGGRIKARLVSAVVIEESQAIENKTLCIGSIFSPQPLNESIGSQSVIVSPYFNSNLIYSLGSKPRAPTGY